MKRFYVYILCNKRNGTLYTGITSDLIKRIYEHKNNLVEGFIQKYNIHRLVWYEMHEAAEAAISREKQIKTWKRQSKLRLIEKNNSEGMICTILFVKTLDSCLRRNDTKKRNRLSNNKCRNSFPYVQK